MEGTIKIEAIKGVGLSVEMDIFHVSRLDMMAVFDALADGFKLNEEDRKIMGIFMALGGVNALPNAVAAKVSVDKEMFEFFKNFKERKDGAEAT